MIAVHAISRYFSIYRALSGREQKVLLASLVLLPAFWVGLRLAGLQRFQVWLDRFPITQSPPLSQAEAAALGLAVNRAANHVFCGGSCLTRSLLLRWLLRRFGTASDLRIGVCFDEGKLLAHAWVEQKGVLLNDRPEVLARYAVFDRPIAPEMFS